MPRLRNQLAAVAVIILVMCCFAPSWAAEQESSKDAAQAKSGEAVSAAKVDKADLDFLASLEEAENPSPVKEKEPSIFMTVVGFILRLGLVLALAYITILVLKKFTGVKNSVAAGAGQRIRVIEHSSLGTNKSLHLIEIGNRKLLVASTPNQVNLITELSEEDMPEPIAPQPIIGFKEQLSMFLGSKPDTSNTAKSVAEMLRESTCFLQGKVGQVASIRGKIKDA